MMLHREDGDFLVLLCLKIIGYYIHEAGSTELFRYDRRDGDREEEYLFLFLLKDL